MREIRKFKCRLYLFLRETSEYANCEDTEILKSAATKSLKGKKGIDQTFEANKRARLGSADACVGVRAKPKLNNDWIPTEAVRSIL